VAANSTIHYHHSRFTTYDSMIIKRAHSWKKEIAQYILLGIPTIILVAYVLRLANQYFAFLENNWQRQTLDFAAGLGLAIFIFARRFRFVTVSAVFLILAWLIYQSISRFFTGEFDAFFWSVKFLNHIILFFCGWVVGYGLSRARFFSIFWSVWLLAAMLVVVSKVSEVKADIIIMGFAPILVYAFYIIYTSELIRNMNEDEPAFAWFVIRRLFGFGVLVAVLLFGLLTIFRKDFEAVEKEWGGGAQAKEGKDGGGTMTRNDGQGTTTQNNMGLEGMNNKANKDSVLFVAKLDNYFPDGNMPNPLYFTSDYFSKFDVETQSFEIDSLRPSNDLFSPDVSRIPLFFTKEDTSVIRKSMGDKFRKITTAEVYKHNLSPRLYLAPSVGFFVQPISVPDENKDIYKSAYRAKMYVSELNSAYFVYNPVGNKDLAQFQKQRFEVLRKAPGYDKTAKNFYDYYTFIPKGNEFDSIRVLANQIVAKSKAKTTVDKILAVRDYFLEKDENGQPSFKYSDNPGIPGLPSANKLTYFLFQNKKGYCAYFAGATLFLLRGLGIPSRVATGFLTVDRSNKNPGWYWFYEDQAHAWVQAWFPEYGWIDFDTTVPLEDQQQAPQPDQTPPLTSQTAWLVANGRAISIDTAKKQATMEVDKMLYWDNPYAFEPSEKMLMDVSLAKISRDSGQVALKDLHKGDEIVSVSYSMQFKKIPPKESDSGLSLLKRFPDPAPIDEIKIMDKEEEVKKEVAKAEKAKPVNWNKVFLTSFALILFAVILLFSLPWLIFQWLHARARPHLNPPQRGGLEAAVGNDESFQSALKKQAYRRFLASSYYLNQMGYERGQLSAAQFAREKVDPAFGTHYSRFMNTFLKTKYSRQPLDNFDSKVIDEHYPAFYKKVKSQLNWKYRMSHWLNFYRPIAFFSKPKIK
jgi:hypothetical protein